MAKKPTITTIDNIDTSENVINENFVSVQDAFDNTISRDGSTPNSMSAELDMNSNRIINLPDPLLNNEPVTLGYLETNGFTSTPTTSFKLLNSATDSSAGFLTEKLSTSNGLTLTTLNGGADEVTEISPVLAADSGLEETATGLQVKDGEGIAVDTDGVSLDLPSLTNLAGASLDGTDTLVVYDTSALEHKEISVTDFSTNLPTVPDATDTTKGIVELATNTEAKAFTDTSRAIVPSSLSASLDQIFICDHRESPAVTGDDISTSWTTCTLNNIVYNSISGASLSSNIITLPTGVYDISFIANGEYCRGYKGRLTRITPSSAVVMIGSTEYADTGASDESAETTVNSSSHAVLNVTSTSTFKLEQIGEVARTRRISAVNFGVDEVYHQIYIRKIG